MTYTYSDGLELLETLKKAAWDAAQAQRAYDGYFSPGNKRELVRAKKFLVEVQQECQRFRELTGHEVGVSWGAPRAPKPTPEERHEALKELTRLSEEMGYS